MYSMNSFSYPNYRLLETCINNITRSKYTFDICFGVPVYHYLSSLIDFHSKLLSQIRQRYVANSSEHSIQFQFFAPIEFPVKNNPFNKFAPFYLNYVRFVDNLDFFIRFDPFSVYRLWPDFLAAVYDVNLLSEFR